VVCVRCEEINISGTFIRNKRKAPARRRAVALAQAVAGVLAGGGLPFAAQLGRTSRAGLRP